MFASAQKALGVIFHPAFRGVLLKSLLLTAILFAALFGLAEFGLSRIPPLPWGWANTLADVAGTFLITFAIILLGPPVAALFASFFLGSIAKDVEATSYPGDPPSAGIPFWTGLGTGGRLILLVLATTIALLPLDEAFPPAGEAITIAVNAWIMGREFFELAALRHLPPAEVSRLRRRHAFAIWLGGLLLSILTVIPVLNFIAPLYGSALMVHLFKRYAHREGLA